MYLFKTSLQHIIANFIYIYKHTSNSTVLSYGLYFKTANQLQPLLAACMYFKQGLNKVKIPNTFESHALHSCAYLSRSSHESEC